jgi:hypothetical protein
VIPVVTQEAGNMKLLLLSLIAVSSIFLAGCEHDAKTPNEIQSLNAYYAAEVKAFDAFT